MYLFIDTTEKITLGLMNKDMQWLEFIDEDKSKISSQIHSFIYELLEKKNIKITDLDAVIYCAGPGSYTGMRVSEGFADILEWQNIKTYTFFHFEIPKFIGVESGKWISEAFKGEYFVYDWKNTQSNKKLIKKEEYSFDSKTTAFAKNNKVCNQIKNFTDDLIRKSPEKIFPHVLKNAQRKEILYYRKLEQEFSRQ